MATREIKISCISILCDKEYYDVNEKVGKRV